MTSLIDWAMRNHVLQKPPGKLATAQDPVLVPAEQPPAGQTLAITSGKGGVGKTWLSVSLAEALATPERRPLLFDGDLGLANVDIQLGLMPRRTLADIAMNNVAPEDALTDAGTFDVLAGASGSAALASVKPDQFATLSRALKETGANYPVVLYDLGSGISRSMVQLALVADVVLVLITADPTSLTDAYAVIKVLRACREDVHILCAVNLADSKAQGRETFRSFAKICQQHLSFSPECAGVLRRDRKVTEAIRSQANVVKLYPQSRATADILELARWLESQDFL